MYIKSLFLPSETQTSAIVITVSKIVSNIKLKIENPLFMGVTEDNDGGLPPRQGDE